MGFDAQLIAPINSGLSRYHKPFLIERDAFTDMQDCYSQRGTVKKREGSTLLGRLPIWRISTGITNTSPPVVTSNAHGLSNGDMVWLENVVNETILTITIGVITQIMTTGAHGLSTGQTVFFTDITGTVGDLLNDKTFSITVNGANTFTISQNSIGSIYISGGTVFLASLTKIPFVVAAVTLNTFTLTILSGDNAGNPVNAAGTAITANIYLPIVGLPTWNVNTSINELLIAFNPKKAYLFDATTGNFVDISFTTGVTAISWTGTKDNFFWFTNYAGSLWVTNFVDPVRYWTGSTTSGWFDLTPTLSAGGGNPITLTTAKIVIAYKGRLVLLNTVETQSGTPTSFRQRARYSQIGTPYVANPQTGFEIDINAWRSDITGKGGLIDADTSEQLISAGIIDDILIVNFQFSTWRLRFTGNQVVPFIWERIDTQFGSEAQFSTVSFDQGTLTISRRGIVACMPNGVKRIDVEDIPDQVLAIEAGVNGEGFNRIFGSRDYEKRLIYWTYGDANIQSQTPDKVLCFNYQDQTWAILNLSFTCLGRYKLSADLIWANWFTPWQGDLSTWDDVTPQDSASFIMLGGRADSAVWIMMNPDVGTDLGTHYNFTLTTKFLNPYFDKGKRCRLAYMDLYISADSVTEFAITNISNSNPALVTTLLPHTLKTGSTVVIQDVENATPIIDPTQSMTILNNKEFTVRVPLGSTSQFYLNDVNSNGFPAYLTNSGAYQINGEVTALLTVDDNTNTPIIQRRVNTSTLNGADGKYVRIFLNAIARFHQVTLTLSDGSEPFLTYPPGDTIDNQLQDVNKGINPFILQGFVLHTRSEGRLKQ